MMGRFITATFLMFQVTQAVSANDEIGDIDKARIFPIQKNNTVIHHSSSNTDALDAKQATSTPPMEADVKKPKDTSLTINGNGGSTNRAAGGNAVLKKRFAFD